MLIVDNIEDELKQPHEDLLRLLQLKAHVEGLYVCQVLQQVEVPFGDFETSYLYILCYTDENKKVRNASIPK